MNLTMERSCLIDRLTMLLEAKVELNEHLRLVPRMVDHDPTIACLARLAFTHPSERAARWVRWSASEMGVIAWLERVDVEHRYERAAPVLLAFDAHVQAAIRLRER